MTHPEDHRLSVGRRSLLRTTAHAAWSVPAIGVVAAAPAFADSHETVPFGSLRVWLDPGGLGGFVTDFNLTYNHEPWSAGDVYLTITNDTSSDLRVRIVGNEQWTLLDNTGPLRLSHPGPTQSETTFGGPVYLESTGLTRGTTVTATLGDSTGTVAYAQDPATF